MRSVAVTSYSTIAVTTAGEVWTWGGNADGLLGDGTFAQRSTPAQITRPPGMGPVREVRGVYSHVVALTEDGQLWAWGSNDAGELGSGTTGSAVPVRVTTPAGVVFDKVSVAVFYAIARDTTGRFWGWGATQGAMHVYDVPSGVVDVDAGYYFQLLRKADGTVLGVGDNGLGQLGDGTSIDRPAPVPVAFDTAAGFIGAVSAGGTHSAAVPGTPGLALEMWVDTAANPGPYWYSVPLTYTVTNNLATTVTGVHVRTATGSAYYLGASCPSTPLESGHSVRCYGTVAMSGGAASVHLAGSAAAVNGAAGAVVSAVAALDVPRERVTKLDFVKTVPAGPGPYRVGDVVEYKLTITNTGNDFVHHVAIDDPDLEDLSCWIPGDITLVDPLRWVVFGGGIRASRIDAEMMPNNECTGTYTVTEADRVAGRHVNTATVQAFLTAGEPGPTWSATATILVEGGNATHPAVGIVAVLGVSYESSSRPQSFARKVILKSKLDPVNTATGSFTHQVTDMSYGAGRGVGFDLVRSYDSRVTNGSLGGGWGLAVTERVVANTDGSLMWTSGTGTQLSFVADGSGGYTTPPGVRGTVRARLDGGWEIVRDDQVRSVFNAAGLLVSRVDRSGQGLTYAYDGAGNVVSVTDGAGRVFTFAYATTGVAAGRLVSVTGPDDSKVIYRYVRVGTAVRLDGVRDVRGGWWTNTYDANGLLVSVTDPVGGREVTNTFDGQGRVVSQADALGKVSVFVWDDVAQKMTMTDAAGAVTVHDYSGFVLGAAQTPAGSTMSEYTAGLDVKRFVDENGAAWVATYDGAGNMTGRTDPTGRVESWTFDAMNNPLTHVDTTGATTSWVYDGNGRVTGETRGVSVRHWAWNGDGTLASFSDATGATTSYAYDGVGNRVSMVAPSGAVTRWEYDTAGRVTRMIPPRGNVAGADPAVYDTVYRYDRAGNLIMTAEPGGRVTRDAYDAAGRLVSVTAPDGGVTTFEYNAAGEVVRTTAPGGAVTTTTYSDRGERLSETDASGATTTWVYDDAGRMIATTDPVGATTTYGYDGVGRQNRVTDAAGRVTTTTYDAAGRVVRVDRPDGHTITAFDPVLGERRTTITDQAGRAMVSQYSVEGWLSSSTDPAGHVTSYGYDGEGRQVTVTTPDGATMHSSFDADGRVVSTVTASGATTSYGYDVGGNQVTVTDPLGRVTTSTYDSSDRLLSTTDPAGRVIRNGWDRMGRIVSVTATGQGRTTYGYSAAGDLVTRTDALGKITSYAFDVVHRQVAKTDPLGRSFSYAYDAAGRGTRDAGHGCCGCVDHVWL